MPETNLDSLLGRRRTLLDDIAAIGDLRPGSLKARFRKCGKPNCHCAADDHPGHGPQWSVSRVVQGKMHSRAVPPWALAEARRQVEECHRLRRLTAELIEVSGAICERRVAERRPAESGKRGRPRTRSGPNSGPNSSA